MNLKEYIFGLISEEGSEVSQAAHKCNRFTTDHAHYEISNIELLQVELNDLATVLDMYEGHFGHKFEFKPCPEKRKRVEAFMQISRDMGTLQ